MGGLGSGSWYRWQGKKSTVEESLSVSLADLRQRLHPGSRGSLTWTWTSGRTSSIGYFVTGTHDAAVLNLHYRWGDSEDVQIPIRLDTTPTQFGGRRWWFICPLIVQGVPCNRRAGKLHLPPGARYFGCRTCHDLTYRSCQEAHKADPLVDLARMERWLEALKERRRRRVK